ncbi:MAG TPA: protoporphyrinogen oxidase [Bacteroidetes bacterium]|nr:protoporphyrinogen oxidase [Bacteroidota bacterium]
MQQKAKLMIAIIGAGITGLTLADLLLQQGEDVRLYEGSDRVGGNIRSVQEAGCLLEVGPNSLRLNDFIYQFLESLDLSNDLIYAEPSAKHRYILREGHLQRLPTGPISLIFNRFLSFREKLRALRERRIPAGHQPGETVEAFFRRRFGGAVADYLVGPFISGIYAGDPSRLLVADAFPKLVAAEQEHGSVIRGMLRQRSKNQHKGIISLREGLEMIPRRLAKRLGDRLETSQKLAELRPESGRFRLLFASGHAQIADKVVLAVPAYHVADLVAGFAPAEAAAFRAVPYPPVALVHSLYRREDVQHRLDGFGALNNYLEARKTLGTIFSSSTFAGRSPEGTVLFTSFVGGARNPHLAQQPQASLLADVRSEMQTLFGTQAAPLWEKCTVFERAIPQYEASAAPAQPAAQNLQKDGLWMAGNWIGGISVVACIERAHELCEQLSNRPG